MEVTFGGANYGAVVFFVMWIQLVLLSSLSRVSYLPKADDASYVSCLAGGSTLSLMASGKKFVFT